MFKGFCRDFVAAGDNLPGIRSHDRAMRTDKRNDQAHKDPRP